MRRREAQHRATGERARGGRWTSIGAVVVLTIGVTLGGGPGAGVSVAGRDPRHGEHHATTVNGEVPPGVVTIAAVGMPNSAPPSASAVRVDASLARSWRSTDTTSPASRIFAAARSTGTVSRIEVPAVVTSSTISTRSPSFSCRPTSTPPSPWSLASLRLKQNSTSRPRSANAMATATASGMPLYAGPNRQSKPSGNERSIASAYARPSRASCEPDRYLPVFTK